MPWNSSLVTTADLVVGSVENQAVNNFPPTPGHIDRLSSQINHQQLIYIPLTKNLNALLTAYGLPTVRQVAVRRRPVEEVH